MFPQIGAFLGILLVATAAAAQEPLPPLRLAIPAFGTQAEVEIRDLPAEAADKAAQAALHEIFQIDSLVDPAAETPGGVGALNAAVGQGPQKVDPLLAELLLRSLQFCIWSKGAYGPLGGELYRLWEERQESRRPPQAVKLHAALGSAECNRLLLPQAGAAGAGDVAELVRGSRVDLRGVARGFAVDRAVAVLVEHGVTNAWVEIGNVIRTLGGGPEGEGWLFALPPAPGTKEPLDQIWLRNQTLVLLSVDPYRGEPYVPVLDQRTGVPAHGVITVVVVTEQAADAEPLASILLVFGHREGQMRLGSLEPRPAVYWLLGDREGTPLEANYRWFTLERVRR